MGSKCFLCIFCLAVEADFTIRLHDERGDMTSITHYIVHYPHYEWGILTGSPVYSTSHFTSLYTF